MSSGKCKDIDHYLYILRQVLDGESTDEEEHYLLAHLDNCACCLEAYELEKHVRDLLRMKLQKHDVPSGLASSIKAKILQAAIHER
jgi:anti-sigma factor (TIGR02949 family)